MSKKKPIIDPVPDMTPYSEQELSESELKAKLEKLFKFFEETGINYDKFNPESIPVWDPDKKYSYPNFEQYMYVPGQHDTQKWLQAVKDIYYKEKNGSNRVQSIRQITSGWKPTETYDFLNWLKFYEQGAHLKYKYAQNKYAQTWYENGTPGYFLHIKQDPPQPEVAPIGGKDIDYARDVVRDELSLSEKKNIIEKQRNKIIGRLDSAEKLLRSHDGQIFAGKELEALMEAIYNLKKKIQLVNKISTSTRLYEDMIVREANILGKSGFIKAAQQLQAIADDAAPIKEDNKESDALPPPASPDPPQQGSGSVGGLPSMGPGMPQNPPESAPNKTVVPKGITQFLDNLSTSKMSDKDDLEVNDVMDVVDGENELLVTEAQAIPTPEGGKIAPVSTPKEAPTKINADTPIEADEKDVENGMPSTKTTRDFDAMIDAAFKNLTVDDVVAKLEDLAKIFKTREVPRQLAVVDMMLDSLGLASFFPSLSEATNKSLESNNYISTRIEDILSKLRGTIETNDIDLRGDTKEENPNVQAIKSKLQSNQDKEKLRKEKRKQQEDEEMSIGEESKETPEVEINEDLAQPAPKAAPAKPAVPPIA